MAQAVLTQGSQARHVPESSKNKMMLGEAVPNGARYEGKTLMIVSLLLGFGFAALLTLPGVCYTQEPAIAMAAMQPTQALKASQGQFLHPVGQMQAYSPFNAKKYETLSYLPELSDQDIAKQIEYMIKNKWTPCLEIAEDGDVYLNTEWGQDTTITGIGQCTSCPCSEPIMQGTLLKLSTPAGENSPRRKLGSW